MGRRAYAAFFALALAAGTGAQAQTPAPTHPEDQALEMLKRGIAYRTVNGAGGQTLDYANYLKARLVAGGFADADVRVEKVDDTAYLVARYRGAAGQAAGGKARSILISAHMDVVEADPKDWTRDPFTPVIENGYIFGRGATDMKFDLSLVVAAMLELKREGFKPRRDIVLVFSGDEETTMKTTAMLAKQYAPEAELLLNADGGGGGLREDGSASGYGLQGAEKTYADYELSFTDPGGHSSAPRANNPIYRLSHALAKIEAYKFPAQINDITRASFTQGASGQSPALGAAVRAYAADPSEANADAIVAIEPLAVGQVRTTCVATMVSAGHAPNALPQRATANVNCRIFPGTPVEEIQAKLVALAGDPTMQIRTIDTGSPASPASPLRPDVVKAVTAAVKARYPDAPVVPNMSSGATDSLHFRALGVPSYGTSSIFMKASDEFSHGLNERTPLANLAPGIRHWKSIVVALSR
ncbi:MAG: M20/M25/M40 family metallo-hydrolase [Sphingomonas sp.]